MYRSFGVLFLAERAEVSLGDEKVVCLFGLITIHGGCFFVSGATQSVLEKLCQLRTAPSIALRAVHSVIVPGLHKGLLCFLFVCRL